MACSDGAAISSNLFGYYVCVWIRYSLVFEQRRYSAGVTVKTQTLKREIKRTVTETLDYVSFHDAWTMYRVSTKMTGVNGYNNIGYGLIETCKFDKAHAAANKSKSDTPYSDILAKANQISNWYRFTPTQLKHIKAFPVDVPDDCGGNKNIFKYIQEVLRDGKDFEAMWKDARKGGDNLYKWSSYDWSLHDADGVAVPQPVYIDFGLDNKNYNLRGLIKELRKLKCVHMVPYEPRYGAVDKEFPEVHDIPHYNQDDGRTKEIKVWWVANSVDEYIKVNAKGRIDALFSLEQKGILPFNEFKTPRSENDW